MEQSQGGHVVREVRENENCGGVATLNLVLKFASLSGNLPQIGHTELLENPLLFYSALLGGDKELCVHVRCQLVDKNKTPISIPVHTPYKPFTNPKDFVWNSWLKIPIKYCDLPFDTEVLFTILDVGGDESSSDGRRVIGDASIKLFRKSGCMKTGAYDLKVTLKTDSPSSPCETPDSPEKSSDDSVFSYPDPSHVRRSLKKFSREELEKSNDFLDRFAFAEANKFIHNENHKNDSLYLHIQLPKFNHPQMKNLNIEIKYCDLLENCYDINSQQTEVNEMKGRVFDPDLDMPNLIEEKHKRLMIGGRKGNHSDLKPDAATKKKLYDILCKTLTEKLTEDERNLVWQYRYSLSSYSNALVKFLRSVEWDDSEERAEAVRLMENVWAAPRVQDALELLSEEFASPLKFPCRQFAVRQLHYVSEKDLRLYLLQLVQALRYEHFEAIERKKKLATINLGVKEDKSVCSGAVEDNSVGGGGSGTDYFSHSGDQKIAGFKCYAKLERESLERAEAKESCKADLAEFLVLAAAKYRNVALDLNWYLEVESNDNKTEERVKKIFRAVKVYLDHYLSLLESCSRKASFSTTADATAAATAGDTNESRIVQTMSDQMNFVRYLAERMNVAKSKFSDREKRLEHFKELLSRPIMSEKTGTLSGDLNTTGPVELFNFFCFPKPFPHPMDPHVMIYGLDVDKVTFFNSALQPAKLAFFTDASSAQKAAARKRSTTVMAMPTGSALKANKMMASSSSKLMSASTKVSAPVPKYLTIFKLGDDVRQDQLVLQTIALMDEILKRDHLDLRLVPYRVMATNLIDSSSNSTVRNDSSKYIKCGFIELVPNSETLQSVIKQNGKIKSWMKQVAPSVDGVDGIDPGVTDTYIRSCAGYCVITYILGVGDRHLENLLLTKKGNMFHIDFGFIFDRDPKPLPPPMRLNRDMIEGMGGIDSEQYNKFKSFCFDAFQSLRRAANLILSLFNLMIHSSIPDICLEPDKIVEKVQDKFCLQMSDEEATAHLNMIMYQSYKALFPEFLQMIHEVAVGMRN